MTIQGLPDLDVSHYLRDPKSCKACKHSFYSADDIAFRYLRCSRGQYSQLCCYERDDKGECKPDGIFWKRRGE